MAVFCFGFVADFDGSIVLVVVLAFFFLFFWVCGRSSKSVVVFCFGFLVVICGCCGWWCG